MGARRHQCCDPGEHDEITDAQHTSHRPYRDDIGQPSEPGGSVRKMVLVLVSLRDVDRHWHPGLM
jgi:hypothetical protein